MNDKKLNDMQNQVKNVLQKVNAAVSKSPAIRDLATGTVSGWCTGFVATRIGKPIGGAILIMAVAHQVGIVNVNWSAVEQKMGDKYPKAFKNAPTIKVSTAGGCSNLFKAAFAGGFLLGITT